MVIRTVLDARPSAGRKYALQVALLAASWRSSVENRVAHPLEVVGIGEIPPALRDLLAETGARLIPVARHDNDRFSRTANKVLGATVDPEGPLLLLDNDTCFVGDVDDLQVAPGAEVGAAAAGTARVSSAQWDYIKERLGLAPLDSEWHSLNAEASALRTGTVPEARHGLYVNSGVVWLARPAEFGALWARHLARVADLFENHPLANEHVRGSDQIGLATAIGTWGRFALLDDAFNYRAKCFLIGKRKPEDIRIVHMTAMDVSHLGPTCTVEDAVRAYWDTRIRPRIAALDPSRRAGRLDASEQILDRIRAIITAFRLNHIRL